MASTSIVMAAMPITSSTQSRPNTLFFKPLPVKTKATTGRNFAVAAAKASMKEKVVTGLTAAALTASMVIPEVAEAASGSGFSPSLNNFLLSIAAGGIVLAGIVGAIIGVSNFDPVKRT
ncbi:uncharacterized protein LOC124942095 [Impatiens glandulifera]|uniref:uncharacterized protein LOC124942095 n=1 Tax=Impatiens glandulifera TaxID=253017 RepID=UPI001FB06E11|nr:uncharacterized protein LOC124942095 [Impatiens glandulifera]